MPAIKKWVFLRGFPEWIRCMAGHIWTYETCQDENGVDPLSDQTRRKWADTLMVLHLQNVKNFWLFCAWWRGQDAERTSDLWFPSSWNQRVIPQACFFPNTKRRTWVNKQVPAGNQTCLITERYHQQKSSPSGNPNKIHKNPLTARFPSGFQGTRSRWDRWGVAQATRCSHCEDYGSAPWNRSSWAGNRGGTDIWSWQKTCEKRSKQ